MTPDDVDLMRAFSTISLALFVILMTAALLRMIWRLLAFRQSGLGPPYLLKRDVVLFGCFAVYLGCVLVFRLAGMTITQNPYWVVPSTTVGLGAIAYWVWVEYHLD